MTSVCLYICVCVCVCACACACLCSVCACVCRIYIYIYIYIYICARVCVRARACVGDAWVRALLIILVINTIVCGSDLFYFMATNKQIDLAIAVRNIVRQTDR